ncbi:glycosyltransferase family 4 protein [filamentous cyanobacterium LEGE 11480]|uniref:Glycosyltransferase family 4 protein n=1 Tax=Romeriopsis navalis LEGE 11480 TaxID=2777977 RepID=A0A928VM11_9CYAN|nr:glycosyltransferase family 4 protein [Romeriopsis navalis]MBE9031026.1 glycosyltransferase family 4 protein [Romeriopsis navalis LEGE 11480]
MKKLAVILSHPIQYYAPWFRYLTADPAIQLRVFYLWNFGVAESLDRGFGQKIQWDIPLLDGYDHEFVPNVSKQPGTHHIWGLQNPSLMQQVRAYQPDAVLMMNYNYASIYQFLWQWQDCPILFRGDSHRLFTESGLKATLRQIWISQVYRRCDRVLYVGKSNRGYFETHGVGDEKLFFSPHAIENQRFMDNAAQANVEAVAWKQALGIPAQHRVVLFAGKFIEKKRPLDLLQAFVQANLPNTSLLFVGAGQLEADLRSQADGVQNVFFAPFQNQSQMPRTYAVGDIFVLPSYGSGETWGLAVNEAMCLSKPVLVSNHVGCARDLVKAGENGLVFAAGNVDSLQVCLTQMLSDKVNLAEWGRHSQELIQQYSYIQMTQGLKQALVSLGIDYIDAIESTKVRNPIGKS